MIRRAATASVGAVLLLLGCAVSGPPGPGLSDPSRPDPRGPGAYSVRFQTTAGDFVVEVDRALAPLGADRFHRLVALGYYDDSAFFRVIPRYIAQFGIAGSPDVALAWREAYIPDDPQKAPCSRGAVAFASKGANTRATQVFISTADNPALDGQGFAPFGRVARGLDVVDRLRGYGRQGPQGERTDQSAIFEGGNAYLRARFPDLDYIRRTEIMDAGPGRDQGFK